MTPIITKPSPFLMDRLPLEIVERIAHFLPQSDLIHFSQTSRTYKTVSFHELLHRVTTTLSSLPQKILASFEHPNNTPSHTCSLIQWTLLSPSFPQLPLSQTRIKQTILADLTHQVAKEIHSLKIAADTAQTFGAECLELEDLVPIPNKFEQHLEAHTLKMLSRHIDVPSKETLLKNASQSGNLSAVTALLSDGPMSENSRSTSLMKAVFYGHLHLIQPLVESGPVSEIALSTALRRAALSGCLPAVQICLHAGPIAAITRSRAFLWAVESNHPSVACVILAHEEILESYKIDGILLAASKGYESLLLELFKEKSLVEKTKIAALINAATHGHLTLVKKIVSLCSIPFASQCKAAKSALLAKHYSVACYLLPLKSLVGTLILALCIGSMSVYSEKLQDS